MSTEDGAIINKGLEGVYVAETKLSKVDGLAGKLIIRGYALEEFATNASYEEMIHLLIYGEFPSREELTDLQETLKQLREIPQITYQLLQEAAKKKVHSMDALRMGVASLSISVGNVGGSQGFEKDSKLALQVIAAVPTILAAYWRFLDGNKAVAPNNSLNHAANFLYMLTGEVPDKNKARALETYLNTVSDHGLNASTFTARTIVSTDSDIISAVTGAIGALKGPKHGGAPGPALDMIFEIGKIENADSYIRSKLDKGERIMGFGHRVYKVRDPRAHVLSLAAETLYGEEQKEFYEFVRTVEKKVVELLAEYKPGRNLQTNVEFYTALILHGVGLKTEIFSSIFALARTTGWVANVLEQYEDNRLIRPRAAYIGQSDKKYTPLSG